MLKRSHYIALGLVTVIALVILNLPARTSARLKLALGSLFLPLFGLVGASQQAASKVADSLTPRAELERQNELLRRENQQLRTQALQYSDITRENDRLAKLVAWQQRRPEWKLKLARVVMRDPANWWRTLQIDLGSLHGVRTNQPVLTPDGLVGRIQSVSLTHSQVVLVGDPRCNVSARVENEVRDAGIIGAGGPFDTSWVEMKYLSRSAIVKPGQNVVTSGEGDVFPKGIPVGRIVDSRMAEFGLYTEARVKLTANLPGLEEVWVMLK
jgi:rod shape-determining protein MreC